MKNMQPNSFCKLPLWKVPVHYTRSPKLRDKGQLRLTDPLRWSHPELTLFRDSVIRQSHSVKCACYQGDWRRPLSQALVRASKLGAGLYHRKPQSVL